MAERKRPVLWSPDALSYLDEIWYYYFRVAGSNEADNILREIGKVVTLVEHHPLSGRSRDEVRPGLRSIASIAISPHVVFYRVMGGRAEIICLLDGRRDIDEIFPGRGA